MGNKENERGSRTSTSEQAVDESAKASNELLLLKKKKKLESEREQDQDQERRPDPNTMPENHLRKDPKEGSSCLLESKPDAVREE